MVFCFFRYIDYVNWRLMLFVRRSWIFAWYFLGNTFMKYYLSSSYCFSILTCSSSFLSVVDVESFQAFFFVFMGFNSCSNSSYFWVPMSLGISVWSSILSFNVCYFFNFLFIEFHLCLIRRHYLLASFDWLLTKLWNVLQSDCRERICFYSRVSLDSCLLSTIDFKDAVLCLIVWGLPLSSQ